SWRWNTPTISSAIAPRATISSGSTGSRLRVGPDILVPYRAIGRLRRGLRRLLARGHRAARLVETHSDALDGGPDRVDEGRRVDTHPQDQRHQGREDQDLAPA